MKKIYVVFGSEDGMLGTCSNMKKAYELAIDYVKGCGNISDYKKYSKVCSEIKRFNYVDLSNKLPCEIRINASIHLTYLNEYCK